MPNIRDTIEPILCDLEACEEAARSFIEPAGVDALDLRADREQQVLAMARVCAALRPLLEQANELGAELEVTLAQNARIEPLEARVAELEDKNEQLLATVQRESTWVNERNGVIAFLSGAFAEVAKAKSISIAKTIAVMVEMTLAEWHGGTWRPGPHDDPANWREGIEEPQLDEMEQAIADREVAWAALTAAEKERDAYRSMLCDLIGSRWRFIADDSDEIAADMWRRARDLLKHGPNAKGASDE